MNDFIEQPVIRASKTPIRENKHCKKSYSAFLKKWLTVFMTSLKTMNLQNEKTVIYCGCLYARGHMADGGDHADPERMLKDSMRRDALVSMGITVITMMKWHIESGGDMNAIAHTIAERIGKRLRYVDPGFAGKNRALIRELFGR